METRICSKCNIETPIDNFPWREIGVKRRRDCKDCAKKYSKIHYSHNNELDKLEDFWLSNEYKLPNFCSNGYNHYLGMYKDCFICKSYREKGELLYEIN